MARKNEIKIAKDAYVDPNATIYGKVTIGAKSSVWPNATIRGDRNEIEIGERTSIQDNVVIHTDDERKVKIGDNVSVGHGAILHGCRIKSNCIVGMGSIVMDGAVVGENSIIGAGSVVTPGKKIPKGSLVVGIPGRVVRRLKPDEIKHISENAEDYVKLSREYL